MTQYVNINIDGMSIDAPKGNSVLDAALNFGICIPHLCRVPYVEDIGACRLCIVEHVLNGRSKITTSCTLLVKEGMVIRSNTEKIRKLRRNLAELLVAETPNSRAIQDVAKRCGVREVRYPFHNSNCILCGRCVRACPGTLGIKPLVFVGRGKNRRVEAPFNLKTELCNECGRCIDLCPMTVVPCDGPMKTGEEYLCPNCESKMAFMEETPGLCVWCDFGEGFQCQRYNPGVNARARV